MNFCMFNDGHECAILTEKKCGFCKFRKTRKEFDRDQELAELSLKKRGLVVVKEKDADGKQFITVKKRQPIKGGERK